MAQQPTPYHAGGAGRNAMRHRRSDLHSGSKTEFDRTLALGTLTTHLRCTLSNPTNPSRSQNSARVSIFS